SPHFDGSLRRLSLTLPWRGTTGATTTCSASTLKRSIQRNRSGHTAAITAAASPLKPSLVLSSQVAHWCFLSRRSHEEKTNSNSARAARSTVWLSTTIGEGRGGAVTKPAGSHRYSSTPEIARICFDCMADPTHGSAVLPYKCKHALRSNWWRNCHIRKAI